MPEGPSIVILKELVNEFKGKTIIEATGNAKFDKAILPNKKISSSLLLYNECTETPRNGESI